jgi:hypothetical protein
MMTVESSYIDVNLRPCSEHVRLRSQPRKMTKSSRTIRATIPKPVEIIDLTDDEKPYDHALGDASGMTTQATELIDLTENIEQCAICDNALGEGDGEKARMFVLKTCHCVGSPLESVLVSIH